jgi:hypothetical protein
VNEWSYTSIPPIRLHGVVLDNFTFTFNTDLTRAEFSSYKQEVSRRQHVYNYQLKVTNNSLVMLTSGVDI